MKKMDQLSLPPAESATVQHRTINLGDSMTLSGLRRAISQVSMLVVKATNSGEAAWREECLKYALVLLELFSSLDKKFLSI